MEPDSLTWDSTVMVDFFFFPYYGEIMFGCCQKGTWFIVWSLSLL